MENRLVLNLKTGKNEFFISKDFFEFDLDFIINNRISNIVIFNIPKLNAIQLEALLNLDFLESLHIGVPLGDLQNLSGKKNIKNLVIGEGNYNIDFSIFKNLEQLFIEFHKSNIDISHLVNLQILTFRNCRNSDFDWVTNFSCLKTLKKLELTDCYLPEELTFLESLNYLQEVEIYLNPKPFRLRSLSKCNQLEKLILSQCPHLQNMEDFPLFQSLKWLRLRDCGPIEDCSLFYDMPNLEVLIVTGKSYFVNGDLSGMMGRLKHFGIENKKHYSHKPEDFPSIFRK
jgi:hypothetical protein